MIRRRVAAYRDRIRGELDRAISEDHTPHEIAGSFAFGTFITMLPTLGSGLLVLAAAAAVVDRISRVALFASVLVFNPAMKWGVYGSSFWLGTVMLGPVADDTLTEVSFAAGPDVIARLLLGNLILAVVAAMLGYVLMLRLVHQYRRRDVEIGEFVAEPIAD